MTEYVPTTEGRLDALVTYTIACEIMRRTGARSGVVKEAMEVVAAQGSTDVEVDGFQLLDLTEMVVDEVHRIERVRQEQMGDDRS